MLIPCVHLIPTYKFLETQEKQFTLYPLTEYHGESVTTKAYSTKYRNLKETYERIIGKSLKDVTWGRLVTDLRRYFFLNVEANNAQNIVETYAGIKKRCPAFSFHKTDFKERWQAFKHFYESPDINRSGKDSLIALAIYLEVNLDKIPRSTRYYWFNQSGLNYKADSIYSSKDLALVAFVATQWAINKRLQPMKSANPDDNSLAA